jgi:hypothetical protein
MRIRLILLVVFASFAAVKAQNPVVAKPVDSGKFRTDTLAAPAYVNEGKIAGRKAFRRSLVFPGLGQIYNYGLVVQDVKNGRTQGKKVGQKIYIIAKIAAIYAGGTMLVMSYSDNRMLYKEVLAELQYRQVNKAPNLAGRFAEYTDTDALNVAKSIYKRNSQIVLISLVGLYAVNAIDAYVTTRLKFFNIEDNLALKVSPSLINANTMYGFNAVPSLKLTFKL